MHAQVAPGHCALWSSLAALRVMPVSGALLAVVLRVLCAACPGGVRGGLPKGCQLPGLWPEVAEYFSASPCIPQGLGFLTYETGKMLLR